MAAKKGDKAAPVVELLGTEHGWETVCREIEGTIEDGRVFTTRRLPVPGGHLYQTEVWDGPAFSQALTFVPAYR